MDKNPSPVTDQVLNLTLEIIFLLTGEDYFLVKKPVSRAVNNSLQVVEGTSGTQTDIHIPLPHEPKNKQEILEVTNKIITLLTREVPIRCQDVTVYFSMEEWEYLEGHKDLYKEVIMEDLTGLPKGSTNECLPRCVKEEQHEGSLKPKIFTPTDHHPSNIKEEPFSCDGGYVADPNLYTTMDNPRRQYPVTYVKEEPSTSAEGQDQKNTQQYQPSHIEDDPVSQNGGNPTHPDIYSIKDHTEQSSSTYRNEKPGPYSGGNHIGNAQHCASTHVKDGLILQDGGNPTHSGVYLIKDHAQQCSSPCMNEKPVPYSGGDPQHYPSTPVMEDTNLSDPTPPVTQSITSDNVNVQYSCSECQKCFLSMSELVSHQGIHIAEKLLPSGSHVFTTTIVHIPQEAPVKHKLLTCAKCGRTFYTKSSLVGHMKTHWAKVNHLVNETFKCEQCGKCFSSRSLLSIHSRVHFGDRPYACSMCGERFMRTSDLGRHYKKHR